MQARIIAIRALAFVLLLFAAGAPRAADADAGPPNPVGTWRAELEPQEGSHAPPRHLVLRIRQGREGLVATLDGLGSSPHDQPVENLTLIEDVLSFQLAQVQVRYAGNFSPVGDSLRGTWSQGEESRPLIFFRD